MIGKVSMFSGHSGVGEINIGKCHGPSFAFKTKAISERQSKGSTLHRNV
jgi:putative ribosome biogenesis GTPase RsgA